MPKNNQKVSSRVPAHMEESTAINQPQYITVPNLEKWQHYKDRCPPWIKFNRDILNNYIIACLQDASKAHLFAIWLLASQMDNRIPKDPDWIARKINATHPVDLNVLIEHGFIEVVQPDSKMIAACKQNALAEAEAETEAESHPERKNDIGQRVFITEEGTRIDADTGDQLTPFDEGVTCSY